MTADERIEELLARAGQPVMIVKGEDKYSESERLGQIDKQAREMSKELNSPMYYECTIRIMGDEIIEQDAKIRNMANTIDRLEAALSNVINEREQLKRDLREAAMRDGLFGACIYCDHVDVECHNEPCKTFMAGSERPNFEWRGLPESEAEHDEV